jgi:hypothetical protein
LSQALKIKVGKEEGAQHEGVGADEIGEKYESATPG